MMYFKLDGPSQQRLSAMLRKITRAQNFAETRQYTLIEHMKEDQARAWKQNFPMGGRYGNSSKLLSPRTIENRAARGFPTSPPLLRSGRMRTFFFGDIDRGIISNNGVSWSFQDYVMKSDDSAMVVHQNKFRPFVDLTSEADLPMHERRAEAWLKEIARIISV